MANPAKWLKWIKQFTDPAFNPERRSALQMVAAAPLASKFPKFRSSVPLDPVEFYRGLVQSFPRDENLTYSGLYDQWLDRFDRPSTDEIKAMARDAAKENWEGDTLFTSSEAELEDASEGVGAFLQDFDRQFAEDPYGTISDYAGDDYASDYQSMFENESIDKYVNSVAQKYGIDVDDLMRQMKLDDFIEVMGRNLDVKGYKEVLGLDDALRKLPDAIHMDPESLRYALMRQSLDHPLVRPADIMEMFDIKPEDFAGIDVENALARRAIDNAVFGHYNDVPDLNRMHPSVRDKFLERAGSDRYAGYYRDKLSEYFNNFPEFQPLSFLPSYIGGRSGPFRVGSKNKLEVKPPLGYSDTVKVLPPEEYSSGGYVD